MLTIDLLGTPRVELDGKAVTFPFKRADALLYYMAVRRSATRQELISLLWESCDESLGLKNLRNTLYTLKKCLGGDFLLSPQKAVVAINPGWELACDYDRFLQGDFSAYQGQFLQGFSVKNAFSYEEWLGRTRDKLHAQYLGRLAEQARAAVAAGQTAQAVHLAQAYLREDPFAEEMAVLLMERHRETRSYAKAAQVYQSLKNRLAEELGAEPQEDTTIAYYRAMNEWNDAAKPAPARENPVPVGREEACAGLRAALRSFGEGTARRCSQLLVGEVGSGKSELVGHFLHTAALSRYLVLRCACLPSEEQLPLACWDTLMLPLGEFVRREEIPLPVHVQAGLGQAFSGEETSARFLQRADTQPDHVLSLLSAVTRRRQVLLVLENIQWMDPESLLLVGRLLRRLEPGRLMAILTCRDDCGPGVREFQNRAVADGVLHMSRLHPLTREQTAELLRRELGEEASSRLEERFYQETRGNLHLLTQLTRAYRRSGDVEEIMRSLEDILLERMAGLGEETVRVAELISVFPEEAPSPVLLALVHRDDRQLANGLKELMERGLIEEWGRGEAPGYRFTHRRIRRLVYDKLTYFERRPLHLRVAQLLTDGTPPREAVACRRIADHFALAGDSLSAARYRIQALELESVQSCEPFGAPASPGAERKPPAKLEEEARGEEETLARLRREPADPDSLARLERRLLLIRGRIALFAGRSGEGISLLGSLSEGAAEEGHLMAKACSLLAQWAIYTQATALAERYTLTGLRLLDRASDPLLFAQFQRLRGDCFCLEGEYEKSVYYLQEAADALENLPGAFAGSARLQLAGVCYDRGRVSRHLGDLAKAAAYYKQALALLGEQASVSGAVWILANYGRLAFSLEDHSRAREFFLQGYRAGQATGELWGMTAATAFAAYYEMLDGAYPESARLLEEARITAKKLASPLEEAILCYVCMLMRELLDQNERAGELFAPLLPYSAESYARQGTRKLPGVPDIFEVEHLSRRLREGITTQNRYRAAELYSKNKHFMTE